MWPGNPFLHPAWMAGHHQVLEPELVVAEHARGDDSLAVGHVGDGPLRLVGDRLSDRLDIPAELAAEVASEAFAAGREVRFSSVPLTAAIAVAVEVNRQRRCDMGPPARLTAVDPCLTATVGHGSWLGYLDGPAHRRRRRAAGQAVTLLSREGWQIETLVEPDAIGAGLHALEDLHHRRFGERSRSFEPQKVALLASALPQMAADGAAAIRILRVDGEAVAAMLLLLGKQAVWFHQAGWDPARASEGVGRALLADSVRWACEQGVDFHLLRGPHDYKTWWGTGYRPVATVEVRAW